MVMRIISTFSRLLRRAYPRHIPASPGPVPRAVLTNCMRRSMLILTEHREPKNLSSLLPFRSQSPPARFLCRYHIVGISPLAATLMDLPAKYCKQKTYLMAKPFRCNTYKNTGGPLLASTPLRTLRLPVSVSLQFRLTTQNLQLTIASSSRASCYTVPPMARQRLGQHFLADLHWREEIARAIRVSPHSTVPLPRDDQHCWIEIGSGQGEMTQHLLAAGTPVHAIEIDPAFLPGLRHLAKQFPNLTVVPGDILEADIAAIAAGRRLRIYGNLPYYITSPILHHLFTFVDFIDEIHIVIQTEVARRLAAQPATRDYGYLSVVTQFYTRPEFVFEIPRDAFEPPPEVASALVTLRLPGERAMLSLSDASRFLDFVKLCFSQKRKP